MIAHKVQHMNLSKSNEITNSHESKIRHFSFACQKIRSIGWLRREICKKLSSKNGRERNGVVKFFVGKKKTTYRWGSKSNRWGRFLRVPKVPTAYGSSGTRKLAGHALEVLVPGSSG